LWQTLRVSGNLRQIDCQTITDELNRSLGLLESQKFHSVQDKHKMHNLLKRYKKKLLNASQTATTPLAWSWFQRVHTMQQGRHQYTGIPGGMDKGRDRPPLHVAHNNSSTRQASDI
jgi:hypothetical protein